MTVPLEAPARRTARCRTASGRRTFRNVCRCGGGEIANTTPQVRRHSFPMSRHNLAQTSGWMWFYISGQFARHNAQIARPAPLTGNGTVGSPTGARSGRVSAFHNALARTYRFATPQVPVLLKGKNEQRRSEPASRSRAILLLPSALANRINNA